MKGNRLKGHLDLLLLAVIDGEALHGYAIIRELRARSAGAFELPEGTIYPALRRLEHSKLVRSRWHSVDGRRRRVYALTSAGTKALGKETQDWGAFEVAVNRVLEVPA